MDRFEIQDRDLRHQFIEAFESQKPFITQIPRGKEVEKFDGKYGFYLAKYEAPINFSQKQVRRTYALAKFSLMFPKLGLRELYYALRQNPDLVKFFNVRPEDLYSEILERINTLEILADVDRIKFTISTSSKGYIFYPYSRNFGDKKRKVAFTEELAVSTLKPEDLPDIQNIVVIEKESGANRLIEMGFPELTNTSVITVGGMFNRAVFRFAQKFGKDYPLTFFCDGDVYGSKILSTVTMGSARSRHLNLRAKGGRVYVAGLYPSVGEAIGLPNDVEEKRPLSNKEARKMLEHLRKFGLVSESDVTTWENNKTYELEALSTSFTNNKGEPIGLGIYITEFMRLNRISPKPLPTNNDRKAFDDTVITKIENRLRPSIPKDFIKDAIKRIEDELLDVIYGAEYNIQQNEFEKYNDEIINFLSNIPDEVIKNNLIRQYCYNMRRQRFNTNDLANKVIDEAKTEVVFDEELFNEIKNDIDNAIEELIDKVKPKIEELMANAKVKSTLRLKSLEPTEPCNLYDKVLKELGAKPKDAELIRKALIKRLGVAI